MKILENLNERLCIYEEEGDINNEEEYRGATEQEIKDLEQYAGFKLPEDYIEFLKDSMNIAITSKDKGHPVIAFWDVENIMKQREWYSFLEEEEYKGTTLIIGDDIGDYFLMYQFGEEGFGLYCEDAGGGLNTKIAETLTELLVEGKGLDKCFDGFE